MGPALVIIRFQIEKELISVTISQKIRMVTERLLDRVIFTEAFSLPVIILIYGFSIPIVSFDTEMIIGLYCQVRLAVT